MENDSEKPIAFVTTQRDPDTGEVHTYYFDGNYPDEGNVGPFLTAQSAVDHAAAAGYQVEILGVGRVA